MGILSRTADLLGLGTELEPTWLLAFFELSCARGYLVGCVGSVHWSFALDSVSFVSMTQNGLAFRRSTGGRY
jgi:hypothetical protein